MKKILLLSTGGTISGRASEQGFVPALTGAELLQAIPQIAGFCQVEVIEALNLDSSNLQPEEWQALAQTIFQALDSYDGFVISHGTDTMAYTAAALSFMLRGLDKPVMLTGAQIPVSEPQSDGPGNLYDAFSAAASGQPGVYVVFAGKIIRGCRAVKVCTSSKEAFFSVNAPLAGQVTEGRVLWQNPLPAPSEARALENNCQSRVCLLKLAPGLEPDMIEAAILLGYRGIVIEAYGIGNITNTRRDISAALAKAIRSGIPVAVTSQCLLEKSDMSVYSPGLSMEKAGAIPGGDMTTEALYVKLAWALAKNLDAARLRELMTRNIVGEREV